MADTLDSQHIKMLHDMAHALRLAKSRCRLDITLRHKIRTRCERHTAIAQCIMGHLEQKSRIDTT